MSIIGDNLYLVVENARLRKEIDSFRKDNELLRERCRALELESDSWKRKYIRLVDCLGPHFVNFSEGL